MIQEYHQHLPADDIEGPSRNYIATSISIPLTRSSNSTHSEQHHHALLIDDEPLISDLDYDNDVSADPLTIACGYTKPFMFLDMIWSLSFVIVSVFVLLTSTQERPSTPLRLWICGYAFQCLLQVGFVLSEYQRLNLGDNVDGDFRFNRVLLFSFIFGNSIIKKLESFNTIVSSIWWVFGFYWVVMEGQLLLQDSPRLYWLSVVFLAFDVLFLIFCITASCIIFFMLFCCFPVLVTFAYAIAISEGASENDIRSLPKFLYRQPNPVETLQNYKKRDNLTAVSCNNISGAELILQPWDSECCICLYKYVDGTELCTLPCNHHFHHECIAKWLRINTTCPLCKFNILRGGEMLV